MSVTVPVTSVAGTTIEAALAAGEPFVALVVQGETCPRCHGEGDPGPWDGCRGLGVIAPEPWRTAAERCPTCGGLGTVRHDIHQGWEPCPDCLDGRQVVTLTKPCRDVGHAAGPPCETCDGYGSVTVATATVEVLPEDDRHFKVIITFIT